MTTNSSNARLNKLKNNTVPLPFNATEVPEPATDLLTSMKENTSAHSATANQWTIDLFPNMIPVLIHVMSAASHHANAINFREHSKTSAATVAMYHMAVVYGYFLLNDLNIRLNPSAHARSWAEASWKSEFVEFLYGLPVPEFLAPILSEYQHFVTDKTPNVHFTPSAAGFDHDQFFGRVFPLNMFAALHDSTATLPSSSTYAQVLQDLFSRPLYTITDPAFTCYLPDLLGITLTAGENVTTLNYINSKLYQVFTTIFNPVLFRDHQRRSSLAALSFKSPTYPNPNINAYDLLFSASVANLREIKIVLQSIYKLFDGRVACKHTLSQFICESTSPSITKHGYSTFPLPTWSHTESDAKAIRFSGVTALVHVSEEDRAQDFCFLQRPAEAIPHVNEVPDIRYATTEDPETAVPLPANHILVRRFPFAIRLRQEAANGFPRHDNDDLTKFSDHVHTAPRVLILDTTGDGIISAHTTTASGKIIESFELDGSTIEMPNADKSLGMQNCLFADSAIAYKYVRPGSFYRPRTQGSVLPPLNRAPPNSRPRLPASSMLHDRTKVFLPQLNTRINEAVDIRTLPGLTMLNNVNCINYAQSFIGFKTVDATRNDDVLDAVPGMPLNNLILWSPYTYTAYEDETYPDPVFSNSRHYYLTNLRTIFGTDTNLIKAVHPYEAYPVS
ncbi:coat protein [Crimson clover cryptic virus 2]|uniref:Coat protein n=1 Tax=Crimson clover cryptic virus 2 TaxID=1323528 RepID=M9VR17_9VIRU|nr:coat protein [Crimson clover cryptic virus 2]AGJ83770.1 coat protein [Crimson clover cryptic virus 2]